MDVDTHYSEPHDLWTKRAPAKYKTRVPRVATIDGKISWVIDETHSIGFGGMSRGWPSSSISARNAMGGSMSSFGNANIMGNIVFSWLLDRYPNLKFVSVESGLGWVPFAMETWDYRVTQSNFHLQHRPSEYVKKNIYTSFWFERENVRREIKKVGVYNVMFETDFPHPAGLWPIDDVASAFGGLEDVEIEKVLSGNAVRIYKLPI